MSATPPVNQTKSLVLKNSTPNEASCPSLASDSSSQESGSVEPLNTEDKRRITIALKPGGHLDVKQSDRLLIWSKWMDLEPNPLYKKGGPEHRVWEINRRIIEFEQLYYSGQSNKSHTAGSGNFDSPRPQECYGDKPVDAGVRKRGASTRQSPTKAQNTSNPRSHKSRLSRDITPPKGSDKARLLLGHGVLDAEAGEWHFKCYWFKRYPKEHAQCALYHVQEERSVRLDHALSHRRRNHITQEIYEHIKYLESAEFSHLNGQERGRAMWREAYTVVFPDHRVVKHLLNPFIGELFNDPGKAEELLAATGSSLARPAPALLASSTQGTQQDNRIAQQTPRPNVNITGSGAEAYNVARERPLAAHEGDGFALNVYHRPSAMPFDSTQPILSLTGEIPQPASSVPAILALLSQIFETEHDPRTNRLIIQLPLPIDPQLESAPLNSLAPVHDGHEALPTVSELRPQYWSRIDQFQAQVSAIREDNRQMVQRAAPERALHPAVSARTTREHVILSSQSAPSLITDDTNISGRSGTSSTLEPRTPPEETDMPSNQSRQMILPETSQQDKAHAESQKENIASPSHDFDSFVNYDGC